MLSLLHRTDREAWAHDTPREKGFAVTPPPDARTEQAQGPDASVACRRAAALVLDLLAPTIPAGLCLGVLWLVQRPDQMPGLAGLGVELAIVSIATAVWVVAFLANELGAVARHGRTLGEALLGFEIDTHRMRGRGLLPLVGRSVLRLGVGLLVLSILGFATQEIGENVVGVVVGVLMSAAVTFGVCSIGARGPTTVIERTTGIQVHDRRRGPGANV